MWQIRHTVCREILEEVLPYMNIYPDEKKTGKNKGFGITGAKTQYTNHHPGKKEDDN